MILFILVILILGVLFILFSSNLADNRWSGTEAQTATVVFIITGVVMICISIVLIYFEFLV